MRRDLSALSFLLLSTSLCASLPSHAQTEDPFSIHVESDLVVIHVEVYDKRLMYSGSEAELECRYANTKTYYSLPPSVPFTPRECFRDMVIHGLTAADFHVFEDGIEQKIESVEWER